MIYNINDKFLYKDQEFVVRYVNNGQAWIASIENPLVVAVCINEKGKDKDGHKVIAINNQRCQAV